LPARIDRCGGRAYTSPKEIDMLAGAPITPLLGTVKPEAAKAFYQDVLGLKFITDDTYAMVFEGKNTSIRVSRVPVVSPTQYAVLGFTVTDIEKTIDELTAKNVIFARFGFFVQDARGIWSAPDGAKVAWFHDPDLNMLSLVQHA
jgi:catechol 2,3-dioxygenase-like lactoylglutathione lyase family enzyme